MHNNTYNLCPTFRFPHFSQLHYVLHILLWHHDISGLYYESSKGKMKKKIIKFNTFTCTHTSMMYAIFYIIYSIDIKIHTSCI